MWLLLTPSAAGFRIWVEIRWRIVLRVFSSIWMKTRIIIYDESRCGGWRYIRGQEMHWIEFIWQTLYRNKCTQQEQDVMKNANESLSKKQLRGCEYSQLGLHEGPYVHLWNCFGDVYLYWLRQLQTKLNQYLSKNPVTTQTEHYSLHGGRVVCRSVTLDQISFSKVNWKVCNDLNSVNVSSAVPLIL